MPPRVHHHPGTSRVHHAMHRTPPRPVLPYRRLTGDFSFRAVSGTPLYRRTCSPRDRSLDSSDRSVVTFSCLGSPLSLLALPASLSSCLLKWSGSIGRSFDQPGQERFLVHWIFLVRSAPLLAPPSAMKHNSEVQQCRTMKYNSVGQ